MKLKRKGSSPSTRWFAYIPLRSSALPIRGSKHQEGTHGAELLFPKKTPILQTGMTYPLRPIHWELSWKAASRFYVRTRVRKTCNTPSKGLLGVCSLLSEGALGRESARPTGSRRRARVWGRGRGRWRKPHRRKVRIQCISIIGMRELAQYTAMTWRTFPRS